MERKISRLVNYLNKGEITQDEFVLFVKRDLDQIRKEDTERLLERNY